VRPRDIAGPLLWGMDVELEGMGEGHCSGADWRWRERGCRSGDGAGHCERDARQLDGAAAYERGSGGVECSGLSEKESAAGG
jgi:hypothetical protein